MTENIQRETARIYQFPVRGRTNVSGTRDSHKKVSDPASVHFPAAVSGSAWYHDAAVQEGEQGHKG